MATPGELAKEIVIKAIGDKNIIKEIAGNNRYLALTDSNIYIGSKGIASGSFFGEKVKTYSLDQVSAVDVKKGLLTCTLEIVIPGSKESSNRNFISDANNENIIFFKKSQFDEISLFASIVLSQKEKNHSLNNSNRGGESIPEKIKQLHELKLSGILTEEEFIIKKTELLEKM